MGAVRLGGCGARGWYYLPWKPFPDISCDFREPSPLRLRFAAACDLRFSPYVCQKRCPKPCDLESLAAICDCEACLAKILHR